MYTHARTYVERCVAQAVLTILAFDEIDEPLAWKDLAPVPALLTVAMLPVDGSGGAATHLPIESADLRW